MAVPEEIPSKTDVVYSCRYLAPDRTRRISDHICHSTRVPATDAPARRTRGAEAKNPKILRDNENRVQERVSIDLS